MLAQQKASHNRPTNLSKVQKKTKNCKKLRKINPIFAIFRHIFQQKKLYINKTAATCKLKIAQVTGLFSVPI